MKYTLYHAKPHLFRESMFYRKDGSIFNQHQALEAFNDGEYRKVHIYHESGNPIADGILEHIYASTQNIHTQWKEKTRSTSVGDIVTVSNGEIYIVDSCGFEKIKEADAT